MFDSKQKLQFQPKRWVKLTRCGLFCAAAHCILHALLHYADQCYHHYDDFIVPKGGWLSVLKKVLSQRDLRVISMKQHLQCYSDAFGSPPTLRAMLCQDVSAAIEDICCKFIHLKDGYTCPVYSSGFSWAEPMKESSSLILVRIIYYVKPSIAHVALICHTSIL